MVEIAERRADIQSYLFKLEREIEALKSERARLEGHALLLKRKYIELKREYEKITQPPLMVGTVLEVLPDYKAIVRNSNGVSFLVSCSSELYKKLRPGLRVAMSQQSLAIVRILSHEKDGRVFAFEVRKKPGVTYDQIGGLKEQVEEVREVVELPLKKPEVFEDVGIDPPKAVLLHGPPGTGKTLLAKAVATEVDATFIHVVGSELVHKFIGEGARLVRDIFRLARERKPSIIFIDEIDAIGARRTEVLTGGDREVQRTMMQLLAELDGFKPLKGVAVLAATNRVDILDPALLRPGRFDRVIEVPLPDEDGRYEILRIHTSKMKKKRVSLRKIARLTAGASGADLRAIAIEAGMLAIKEGYTAVQEKHFITAVEKIMEKKREKDNAPIYL